MNSPSNGLMKLHIHYTRNPPPAVCLQRRVLKSTDTVCNWLPCQQWWQYCWIPCLDRKKKGRKRTTENQFVQRFGAERCVPYRTCQPLKWSRLTALARDAEIGPVFPAGWAALSGSPQTVNSLKMNRVVFERRPCRLQRPRVGTIRRTCRNHYQC